MIAGTVALAGCQSQQQMLDHTQAMAVQTAVGRGQFELNCHQAIPTVISREMVQPAACRRPISRLPT